MKRAGTTKTGRGYLFRILILFAPLIIAAGYLIARGEGSFEQNRIGVRYLLFAWSGLVAFIIPYISFPDPSRRFFQLLNLSAPALFRRYLFRHKLLLWIASLLLLVTALPSDSSMGQNLLLLLTGVFLLFGVWLYSAAGYFQAGKRSQQWQESERGRQVSLRLAGIAKYPVDPGSIPSLIMSVKVTLFGMLGVVVGAIASLYGGLMAELTWASLLFLFGLQRCIRLLPEADRNYYQTNAFFGEFFGTLRRGARGSEAVAVDQLWWIPPRWRTNGWALMLQLDRKLPAGRLVAGGHLFLWVLAYRGVAGEGLVAFWLLFAVFHQAFLLLTASSVLVPAWWLRLLDAPLHWVYTRFWIQVRWILPLGTSMMMMMWLFARYGWAEIGLVTGVYLLSAGLVSLLAGFFHERYRRTNGA